jgi:hypothetical protein
MEGMMLVFDVHQANKNSENEPLFMSLDHAYHYCAKLYCESIGVETLPTLEQVKESLKRDNIFEFQWTCSLSVREIVDMDLKGELTTPHFDNLQEYHETKKGVKRKPNKKARS